MLLLKRFSIAEKRGVSYNLTTLSAAMAELVDALDSGSSRGNSVDVRLILAASHDKSMKYHSPIFTQIFEGAESVALIAHGAIHDYAMIASLVRDYDRCVAVDGGLIHCHEMHLRPDLLIGDFDSVSPQLLKAYSDIPTQSFPRDKDQTDMELAVQAADLAAVQKIGIFGAMEWRTDHALANLHLMCRHADKIIIETEKESLFMVSGRQHLMCRPGQTVSLIPLGVPAKGVTTHGLKWELTHSTLDTNFMSISNICLDKSFDITIEDGSLICCLLRL